MYLGFWKNLPRPFSILAPMEEVTDSVFRQIVASCVAPDVFFTEFVNVEGLLSKGRDKIIHRLQFTEIERPIVAQIWGMKPENFYTISRELVARGFDGVDINMGCPERSIVKRGSCAGLINKPKLASEIIQATKEGVKGKIPVSVKTRIGIHTIVTEDWIGFLLKQNLAAITVHGRTVKEQSDVPAHWDEIGKAVMLRDTLQPIHPGSEKSSTPEVDKSEVERSRTLIIGNGDVVSWSEALEKVKQFQVDGVMIGRGIFHNMWVFEKLLLRHPERNEGSSLNARNHDVALDSCATAKALGDTRSGADTLRMTSDKNRRVYDKSLKKMLELLLKHVRLYDQTWGKRKNFLVLRRFFKIYVSGFPDISNLRDQLMQTTCIEEVEKIITAF